MGMAAPAKTTMGIATTSYMTVWRPRGTYEFLEHCHALGSGGIQASLSSLESAYVRKVRDRAQQLGMYIEVMGPLPRDDGAQFEAVVKASRDVGAICIRSACLGGRRYETFGSLADWDKFVADSHAAIERAIPILERHKVKLALENHKDWTAEEFVKLLDKYKSEYLGTCVDTGNNMALLDDPYELVDALAPRAFSTHIKDMGVTPYPDGFLLSEVPLGEGMLDLKRMVQTIQRAHPEVKMSLEMITRDPLKIPCFTEKYWVTFPHRNGKFLARMMRLVEPYRGKSLLQMTGLDPEAARKMEGENVVKCLAYAREKLHGT